MRHSFMSIIEALASIDPATEGSLEAGSLEDGITAYRAGDFAAALRILRPIAEQGNAEAQYSLGVMYDIGEGVPQDYAEAVKWYRLAAGQGYADGQLNLGVMYYNGEGVPQDYLLAHMWFTLAAAQGDADGVKNRDIAASLMTPAQIAEAQKLAQGWMAAHPQ